MQLAELDPMIPAQQLICSLSMCAPKGDQREGTNCSSNGENTLFNVAEVWRKHPACFDVLGPTLDDLI
jgi:hypothetical protein